MHHYQRITDGILERQCNICEQWLPEDYRHFRLDRGLYQRCCRVCGRERSARQARERSSGRANLKEHQVLKHPNLERMIMQEENRQKDIAKKLKKCGLNPKRCSCYEADMALAQ